jgi:hypothetical protein
LVGGTLFGLKRRGGKKRGKSSFAGDLNKILNINFGKE